MVKIVIENWGQKKLISEEMAKTALAHFLENRLDWMHSCGGKGRCTTCKMIVVEGMVNLSEPTPAEINYRKLGALKENERLCCQAKVMGDLRVRVPEANKLPHISYEG
jgi:2Fe-2S ferredoxin